MTAQIANREIADALEDVARLLELDGEGPFRIRAYQNAADMIRFFNPPLAQMVADGDDLTKLEDVGKGIAAKIEEIVSGGLPRFRRDLAAKHGPGMLELLRIPGLGPKKVRSLRDELAVRSVEELGEALEAGRVASVSGFGPKSIELLRRRLAKRAESERNSGGSSGEALDGARS